MKTKLHYLVITLLFAFGMNGQVMRVAQTVTITGTGTGGWNQPGAVALTTTDGSNYTATNFEIVADANMKFSEGGDWGTTYGFNSATTAPGFPSGVAGANAPGYNNNIVGQLGFWSVTYNIVTKEYAFTPGINPNAVINISGGLAADVRMQTNNGVAYNKKSVTFIGGDVKFVQEGTSNQWGGAFPDGPVETGALIPVPAGTFNVYFTKNTLTPSEYLFEPTVVSMIGNFIGSGWGTDIDLATTDNVNFTKTGWVAAPTGTDTQVHLKIRDNHDWTYQFGVPVSNVEAYSGSLISVNAQDMTIAPGTYDVAFNRSTAEYSFTLIGAPKPVIKISGSAIGATDIRLATTDGEAYTVKSLSCLAGTAKFYEDTTSNQWSSINFPIGTGTQSGDLIPVTEATYNVSFTKSTGVYSFDHVAVSIVGGFNNWGGTPDIDMSSSDGINFTANAQVFATNTELKFRDNHDWSVSFGSTVDPSAFPIGTGGGINKNIAVPAGTYDITFNRNTLAYNFTAVLATNSFASSNFKVYPNPTTNNWNVSVQKSQINSIQIVDVLGKVVLLKSGSSNEVTIDASNLNSGIYFARIATANAIETIKLVKN
jgi:hypothetical protein